MVDEKKELEKPAEEKKPEKLSIVDEAKAVRDEIIQEKENLKVEREKLEKAKSEELLGSSAGGHIEPTPAAEESAGDYAKKVQGNDLE